jgi:hypothetical protein
MKTTSILAIVSWLLFASSGVASDQHEADEGLEKTCAPIWLTAMSTSMFTKEL